MSERSTGSEQEARFERLRPETVAYMAEHGYAVIVGYMSRGERELLLGELREAILRPADQEGQIPGRKYYGPNPENPNDQVRLSASRVAGDFVESAKIDYPQCAAWWDGWPPVNVEVFFYEDGIPFSQHIDRPQDGYPTQMLVTLQGNADFLVFSTMNDQEPLATLKLGPGDALLFRGDELGGRQLPHAVENIAGNRIVLAVSPFTVPDLLVN